MRPYQTDVVVTRHSKNSWLFEIALVFVRFDHVASVIVNANHTIM